MIYDLQNGWLTNRARFVIDQGANKAEKLLFITNKLVMNKL
jgi:hypothetical protein